ncbi:hypothetical protein C0993_008327, partial [Termitomyces sp. T159_Od127]
RWTPGNPQREASNRTAPKLVRNILCESRNWFLHTQSTSTVPPKISKQTNRYGGGQPPGILTRHTPISTQEQLSIEKSFEAPESTGIEINKTLGRASEDVNALFKKGNTFEGWQTMTPKKGRKKAKKVARKLQESNKCPHSDSPLKERRSKRLATENKSETSGDGGDYHKSPSPSPALSISALDYTDEEENATEKKERKERV